MDPGTLALVGLVAGIVCGLIPLAAGLIKHRMTLGVVGLVVSALCGALLGILLALPVAIVFTLAIVLMRPERARATTV
jgi:hypothetical protein